ncbi:MAG: hypothetical protein K6A33_13815 [Clostridiales bacterium]|nr:hypothetical protein [Clostridiales bacterium]
MTTNGSGSRIRVFDADGRQIGETYPKRARGLVKHGRAVWLTESSYARDPDAICPDLLLFPRNEAGETDFSSLFINRQEDHPMSEYNNEHEQRINDMIARFRAEMAKAREIAEKATAEAENVIREVEASGVVEKAAEKAADVVETVKAAFAEEAGKVSDTADKAADDLREAVNEAAEDTAKAADTAFESAKRAFEEAEANFEEAKRAFKEAEAAKKAEEEGEHCSLLDEELCRQAKENIDEIRREAKDAITTAWEELKKGWAELKDASSGPVEWLKGETKTARDSLKDAFRELKENLKAMMDDLGDAGDGCDGTGSDTERSADEAAWAWEDGDESEDEEPAVPADRVRQNIEAEMNDVQRRVTEMLELVRKEYDAGHIGFDKYIEYTDKYTAYLHDRLVELREELKKL